MKRLSSLALLIVLAGPADSQQFQQVGTGLPPPLVWRFQFEDPAGRSWNGSDGLEIVFCD